MCDLSTGTHVFLILINTKNENFHVLCRCGDGALCHNKCVCRRYEICGFTTKKKCFREAVVFGDLKINGEADCTDME